MDRWTTERIDRRVIAAMTAGHIPGLALATLGADGIAERSYGAADLATGR